MQFRKLFDIDLGNDIGADSEYLSEFDEAGAQRRDCAGKLPGAGTVHFIAQETRRAGQDPSPAVAQERNEKRGEPIPYDEDSEDHELSCDRRSAGSPELTNCFFQ